MTIKLTKKSVIAAALAVLTIGSAAVCSANVADELAMGKRGYTTSVNPQVAYSGAIIDCRGLGLKKAESPVVVDSNGRIIYGDKNIDYDAANSKGMVGYADGLFDRTHIIRAGWNPIILKAIGLTKNNTCPIISEEAGKVMTASVTAKNYFPKATVVFVYGD